MNCNKINIPYKNQTGRYVLILAGLILLFSTGCSTTAHHQLYSGELRTQKDIAVLYCLSGTSIILYEIDGKAGPIMGEMPDKRGVYNSKNGGAFQIEMLPGKHTLKVGYSKIEYSMKKGRDHIQSIAPVMKEFDAKAGQVYTIRAKLWDGKWDVEIVEID